MSVSGAIAAAAVGFAVFYCGGLSASVVLVTFFLTSSLLSQLPSSKIKSDGPRRASQVLANGLFPAAAMIWMWLDPSMREEASLLFLGSLAVATSDTWSTEIGTRYGRNTIRLSNFRPMTSGVSGGVSIAGVLAGGAGAFIIPMVAHWSMPFGDLCQMQGVAFFIPVLVAGIAGNLLDSLLGGTLQARYYCSECGMTSESPTISESSGQCSHKAKRVRGIPGLTNSMVNFITTVWGGFAALVLSRLLD